MTKEIKKEEDHKKRKKKKRPNKEGRSKERNNTKNIKSLIFWGQSVFWKSPHCRLRDHFKLKFWAIKNSFVLQKLKKLLQIWQNPKCYPEAYKSCQYPYILAEFFCPKCQCLSLLDFETLQEKPLEGKLSPQNELGFSATTNRVLA